MNFFCIIFASILSTTNSDPLSDDIKQYFTSDSVKTIKLIWDDRAPEIEHTLSYAIQDSIGRDDLNNMTIGFRLTKSYYHKHGPVDVTFRNLNLMELPYCWMPEVILLLASNVLQVRTTLTEMVINADYLLLRNKSDLMEDIRIADVRSPFLYKPVANIGKLSLFVHGCVLSGFVIARMVDGTVVLGHQNLTLSNCHYTASIYNSSGETIVTVPYTIESTANTLEITHYLLMTLREEFLQNLQSAVFKYVNNSAIFGQKLSFYEATQATLFENTSKNLTSLINEQNQKILGLTAGVVNIIDYVKTWDYWDSTFYNEPGTPATVKLSNMVLTGLATAYNAYTGGPFKLDTAMIGEQMRFRKLQVHGELTVMSQIEEVYNFTVEFIDFAINIDIDLEATLVNSASIVVVGYRDIEFTQPELKSGPFETFITGYVKNEVSKEIIKTIAVTSMVLPPPAMSDLIPTLTSTDNRIKARNPSLPISSQQTTESRARGIVGEATWVPDLQANVGVSTKEHREAEIDRVKNRNSHELGKSINNDIV